VSPLVPDRRLTAILYLNGGWQPAHGGALHIDARGGPRLSVAPLLGRVVFFDARLMHEVRPAHRARAAVTGWLYGPRDIAPALQAVAAAHRAHSMQ
jgi:Rps23 Pro-64 3,4-dihydroxylase Tpa1-like proline 4-hydroxylase